MKKIFAIIALFALVFTSCQKEEMILMGSDLDTITATIESTNGTKATLDGSYNVVWSEDDEISVFVEVGESVYNVLYTLSSVNSNGTGVFTKTSDHDISGGTIKAAFYPYNKKARYENGTITGVSTDVQGTYSTIPTAARMAAKVESGTNISFKNIGAIVKVTTPNIPTTYSAVQLYSATSYLSGDCSVSFEDDGTPVATPAATGSKKFVTFIDTNTDEAQSGTTQSFYFPIFAGNYSDLTVVAKGGQSYDQELVLIAPKSLTAERSKLYYTSASVKTVTTGVVTLSKVQGSEEQNIEIATEDDQISVATGGSEPVSGKVNISINSNEKKELTITLPDATVLLSGKTTYSSITASTAENTLILGNGVTVTNVTVKKGNVQVNAGATLKSISFGTAQGDATSVVIIDNGGTIDVSATDNIKIMTPAEYAKTKLIEAATKGGTYKLTSDVTLDEILTISKKFVLDGNNYTLTSNAGRAINVETTEEVTIKNLKINGITGCQRGINIINKPGTTNINNVTISGVSHYAVNIATSAGAAKVNIDNSNLTGWSALEINGTGSVTNVNNSNLVGISTNNTDSYATISVSEEGNMGAIINVTGGTITAETRASQVQAIVGASEDVIGCTFTLDAELVLIGEKATYESFENQDLNKSTVLLRKDYQERLDELGYVTEMAENNMVAIKLATYVSTASELKAAINNADITNIILKNNIELTEILSIERSLVLNGNNYTLTSNAKRAINVSGAEDVTIKNLTVNGSGERGINLIQNAKKVTIESCNITADNYAVNVAGSAAGATVIINNSYLTGKNTVNIGASQTTVTINDTKLTTVDNNSNEGYGAISTGAYDTSKKSIIKGCSVNMNGGEIDIKGTNCSDSREVSYITAHNTFTYNGTVATDGTMDIISGTVVAPSGDYYYTYKTLQAAIEKANAGQNLILVDDITLTETIKINKSVTISLNGQKLTANVKAGRAFDIEANGVNFTLNATDSKVAFGNGTYGIIQIVNGTDNATITINGGTFEGTTDAGALIRYRSGNKNVVNLTDVTYTDYCEIKGKNQNNPYAISDKGTEGTENMLNVKGGTYNVGCMAAVTNPTCVFDGITVNAFGNGIEFKSGEINNSSITLRPGAYVYSADGAPISVSNQGNITVSNTSIISSLYGLVVFPTGGHISATNIHIDATQEDYYIYDMYQGKSGSITVDGNIVAKKANN